MTALPHINPTIFCRIIGGRKPTILKIALQRTIKLFNVSKTKEKKPVFQYFSGFIDVFLLNYIVRLFSGPYKGTRTLSSRAKCALTTQYETALHMSLWHTLYTISRRTCCASRLKEAQENNFHKYLL